MEAFIVAITFIATIVGAISGIGGGVIIKPVMDAILELPVETISFLSGTTVLAMTTVSLLRKSDVQVDRRRGTLLAIGGAIGGLVGKSLFSLVKARASSNAVVGMTQNIVMVILTVTVFLYVLEKARVKTISVSNGPLCVICGLFLGILSSFLGIGGGPINIMFLSLFFSMDSKHAALNSLYVIFFSQMASLLANLATRNIPAFSWHLLIAMMASGVCGALVGRKISRKLDNRQVDRLFMTVMLVIIGLSISNVVRFAMAR